MARERGSVPAASPAAPRHAVRLEGVSRRYGAGEGEVLALDRVDLAVAAGEFVAVVGRSGSGKSTLLNLVAGIDTPSSGRIEVAGRDLAGLSDDALTVLRRDAIGMIYQFFNLLPTLTVRENVALPGLLGGGPAAPMLARADARLAEVGLAERARARPHTLSGGELQRAAVARALLLDPALVLADEPTGNLDSRAAAVVLERLRALASARGTTVLLVTHSLEAAASASRIVEMRDGRIVSDRRP